jgi:hypothetical protein
MKNSSLVLRAIAEDALRAVVEPVAPIVSIYKGGSIKNRPYSVFFSTKKLNNIHSKLTMYTYMHI